MHSGGSDGLAGFTCPICGRVGKPEDYTSHPNWSDPVHVQCIAMLSRWPRRARDPLGAANEDSYIDYTGGQDG